MLRKYFNGQKSDKKKDSVKIELSICACYVYICLLYARDLNLCCNSAKRKWRKRLVGLATDYTCGNSANCSYGFAFN